MTDIIPRAHVYAVKSWLNTKNRIVKRAWMFAIDIICITRTILDI